jgi:hypothetical protein
MERKQDGTWETLASRNIDTPSSVSFPGIFSVISVSSVVQG